MPILFSVVARGTTILAKYAGCAGNFTEVVEQVLGKISPENAKLTYSHGKYVSYIYTIPVYSAFMYALEIRYSCFTGLMES